MGVYRYVGGAPAELLDSPFKFTRFGQTVEMPDDLAEHAIAHRVPLIPVEIWDSVSVTDAELKRHARFESHVQASPEFISKRDALWRKFVDHHEGVLEKRKPKVSDAEEPTKSTEEVG